MKCSFCKCSPDEKTIFRTSKKTTAKICHRCAIQTAMQMISFSEVREELISICEKSEGGAIELDEIQTKRLAKIMGKAIEVLNG